MISYSLDNTLLGTPLVNNSGNSYIFSYPCSSSSSCTPYSVVLNPGVYSLECWGSQGSNSLPYNGGSGYYESSSGGKGGYSRGVFRALYITQLYIYLGGIGSSSNSASSLGGWNGGGDAGQYAASGGGATDFRTVRGDWNDIISLNSRLIVAGGGGGARGGEYQRYGGAGGGENGMPGNTTTYEGTFYQADVGTQSNCVGGIPSIENYNFPGGFGYGGGTSLDRRTGGGGGYFGGGGVYYAGGGGGSGYIGNVSSYLGVTAVTITGNNIILEPNGHISTGHSGNGMAKITILSTNNWDIEFTPFNCHSYNLHTFLYIVSIAILINI